MKLVSAIITTHNRLDLLKRAIDSVLSQTYVDIECIVVSDGSTDGTDEYCQSLPRVKFVNIPENESNGGNHARNVGIENSTGEYIAFLDDDDYWIPEKIEKQLKYSNDNDCGLVSCGKIVERVNKDGSIIMDVPIPGNMPHSDMSRNVMYNICSMTSMIFTRKDLLDKVGRFDEKLKAWQEYELLIRLAQITQFGATADALVVYRLNVNDTFRITNKFEAWNDSVKYIYQKHERLYRQLNFWERLEVKHLYYADGCNRAHYAGLENIAKHFEFLCKFYRRFAKIASVFYGNLLIKNR